MSILESLANKLLIKPGELFSFIKSAPYRYKVYSIPKRNGRGMRIIAQPSEALKVMQRLVLDDYLMGLPIHNSATAYIVGKSIRDNALRHANNPYLLKMDFSEFFPSISPADLSLHVKKYKGVVSPEDEFMLRKLFFWAQKHDTRHRLSIGAPSSPFISNTLMYEFDSKLSRACSEKEVVYTRYADDLTLTTRNKDVLFSMPEFIAGLCQQIEYPRLQINSEKTVFSSKKHNRHVTGIVINNKNELSLGREKKRFIKSYIYRFSSDELSSVEIIQLRGLLAFAKHVEVSFYNALIAKYGLETVSRIERYQPV
ncbi:retron St85 family RNA-directed DNA polymerase [Pseudomonas oryzihabitans]|uniref:retron St85 family RNA-directed DNA polymerase n=1 Tax=Pseudomonas oryzihabitans TaxID=47885 RepID=UPI0011A636CF|nr:retron St85 family RNA-directed DNA polymerase [Pseudomonas oryzihabitans]